MPIVLVIIILILLFGAILLVHEFGHFIAARRAGIFVEEFAIGMGPKLLAKKGKETLYTLRLLPIGGFCKMRGEDEEDSDDPRAMNSKPVWKRMIVILAGAAMNFALALVVVIVISAIGGLTTMTVSNVLDGAPAARAGLMAGDRVVSVAGRGVNTFDEMLFTLDQFGKTVVKAADGSSSVAAVEVPVVVRRGGETRTFNITPAYTDADGVKIGVQLTYKAGLVNHDGSPMANPWEHLTNAVFENIFYVKSTLYGIGQIITGKIGLNQLSGPVGVGVALNSGLHDVAPMGFTVTLVYVLRFLALLSANVGVLNLLPLPALDGGRFVFLLIELIRRKPVKREAEGIIHFVGFALLMILMVFVLYSDIIKGFFQGKS